MAIELFGEAHNPTTENANSPSGPTVSITPPSNMVAGDFVLVALVYRGTATWTVDTTGGQTWSSSTNTQGTLSATRLFWCVFNGTWDADPIFTVTSGALGANGWMTVFRGVNNLDPWDVDPVLATQVASLTFVIATYDTNTPNAWALVGASSSDNNTWSVDNSFVAPGADVYWRSAAGTDNSLVIASKELASAGAVGQTTMTQTAVGADAGVKWYAALRAAVMVSAQAQTSIVVPTFTYEQVAQTQTDILQIYQAYAQSNAVIIITSEIYAQAQADILQTYSIFAQAQTDIKTLNNVLAQAQSSILQIYQDFAQAQSDILQTDNVFGQAQAQVGAAGPATYNSWAQGLGLIGVTTDLYTAIDEAVLDNTDYIVSDGTTGYVEVMLDDLGTPMWRQDHVIVVTASRLTAVGALGIALYQGVSQIVSSSYDFSIGSWTTYRIILTSAQINAITDYSDLRLRFTPSGTNNKWLISQAYLQRPPAGALPYRNFAQGQATIAATGSVFAQSQADIIATSQVFAQAQTFIILSNLNAYAQAQALTLQTYQEFAQAQADIKSTYSEFAQSQSNIKAVSNIFAQGQADIKTTYNSFAQAQGQNKQIYAQSSQSQADIKVTSSSFAQAQSSIKQTYSAVSQVQAYIYTTNYVVAQAQAYLIAGTNAYAQSQAYIKIISYQFAQAQGWIGGEFIVTAQTQAAIKAITFSYAQAQSNIKQTYQAYAQAQADIKTISNGYAQAQAKIGTIYNGFAQSQAKIKAFGVQQYAQSQTDVKQSYTVNAQAQADIKAVSMASGQAQAQIRALYSGFGQAQSSIKSINNAFGQAGADIKQTYAQFAQTQAIITTANTKYAQSQANIKQIGQGYAQAAANVQAGGIVNAQVQANILATLFAQAQAQAQIIKSAGYAQAQAVVRQDHILKNIEIYDRHSITVQISDRKSHEVHLTDEKIKINLSDTGIKVSISDQKSMSISISDVGY